MKTRIVRVSLPADRFTAVCALKDVKLENIGVLPVC